jgi:DoxX-like family
MPPDESKKTPLAAHILTALVTLAMLASAGAKFSGAQPIVENFEKLHLTPFLSVIGLIEVACAVLFAVPKTSSLGTLLVTGYFGGAIVAHLTANDAAGVVPAVVLGLLAWVAGYLRNQRLFGTLLG